MRIGLLDSKFVYSMLCETEVHLGWIFRKAAYICPLGRYTSVLMLQTRGHLYGKFGMLFVCPKLHRLSARGIVKVKGPGRSHHKARVHVRFATAAPDVQEALVGFDRHIDPNCMGRHA